MMGGPREAIPCGGPWEERLTDPSRTGAASESQELVRAKARARAEWSHVADRLATVTPAAVGRAVLGVGVVLIVLAFVIGTWPTLLPFAVGGLLAYAALPLVDALDRVMPRVLAAALAMLAVVGVLVGVVLIVVPPLVNATIALTASLPSATELTKSLDDLLTGLPQSGREIARPIALAVLKLVTDGLDGAASGLDQAAPAILQAALGVVGAILGLLVLPTWILTVMTDRHQGRQAFDREVAGWLRPDLWAVVRMADRAAGTYLRGYVVVAFVVAALAWVGFTASPKLGGPTFLGPLALAVFAGVTQVIPEVGPILGFLPAVFLLAIDPPRAGVYVLVYLVARWLTGRLVGSRYGDERLRVHPAILVPGVIILGNIGLLLLLLSGPIIAFGADVVRYVHGRFSEPPRPAGLLPGDPLPVAVVPVARRVRVRRPGAVASVRVAPPSYATNAAPPTATAARPPETREVPA